MPISREGSTLPVSSIASFGPAVVLYEMENAQTSYDDPTVQIDMTHRTAINESRRVVVPAN